MSREVEGAMVRNVCGGVSLPAGSGLGLKDEQVWQDGNT
jgi:hypothetical protein